jgi:2-polyprenyl-6-methoxyphenol hydroxylase-like FAD-dependent oxidoreductase
VKVACVGAGPASLYLAILLKRNDPQNEVTIFEQNRSGVTDGWGVVFWDDLVRDLHENDPETATAIVDQSYRWVDQVLDIAGQPKVRVQSTGFSIRRHNLLNILVARAVGLGVKVQFEHTIVDTSELHDMDLIVAADGAGSRLRQLHEDRYKTTISIGRNKYVWLGAKKVFDSFNFGFVKTEAGWIWFHAYGCDEETSTFIVECSPETWSALGFDTLGVQDSLSLLERIFAQQLSGSRLVSRSSEEASLPWLNFRTVRNQAWYAHNFVLIGDAAHTTHFSIGSGTRLAMQDAMALATHLRNSADIAAGLEAYQRDRRRAISLPQREAHFSARWFENIDRYIGFEAPHFFALMQSRRSPWLARMPPLVYHRLSKATSAPRKLLRQVRRSKSLLQYYRREETHVGRREYP